MKLFNFRKNDPEIAERQLVSGLKNGERCLHYWKTIRVSGEIETQACTVCKDVRVIRKRPEKEC